MCDDVPEYVPSVEVFTACEVDCEEENYHERNRWLKRLSRRQQVLLACQCCMRSIRKLGDQQQVSDKLTEFVQQVLQYIDLSEPNYLQQPELESLHEVVELLFHKTKDIADRSVVLNVLDTIRLAQLRLSKKFSELLNGVVYYHEPKNIRKLADELANRSRLVSLYNNLNVKNGKWNTSTAQGLAHAIYDEQAFDRMPILANALEDAGFEHEWMLRLFREPNIQYLAARGWWILDKLTGRK